MVKLLRVSCLAPWLFFLGYLSRREQRREKRLAAKVGQTVTPGPTKAEMPMFAVGFVILSVLNSVVALPAEVLSAAKLVSNIFLVMAMAALGVDSNLSKVAAVGAAPLYLAAMDYGFMVSGCYFVTKIVTSLLDA